MTICRPRQTEEPARNEKRHAESEQYDFYQRPGRQANNTIGMMRTSVRNAASTANSSRRIIGIAPETGRDWTAVNIGVPHSCMTLSAPLEGCSALIAPMDSMPVKGTPKPLHCDTPASACGIAVIVPNGIRSRPGLHLKRARGQSCVARQMRTGRDRRSRR